MDEFRVICIVTEWLIVAFSIEFALLFWLRIRRGKKDHLKSLQEKAYIFLFIAYGLAYVFFILGDYYFSISYRMVFYDIAYLSLMVGGLIFIKIIEEFKTFYRKNLFTIIFGIMTLTFIVVLIVNYEFSRNITFIYYPVFFLFFLFYIRVLFTDVYKKRDIKGFKRDVANLAMAFLFLFLGYNFATDMAVDIFGGYWIRAFGNILQLIAFIFIFFFLLLSPAFAEFNWQEEIDSIYITNRAGLFIYKKSFRDGEEKTDQNIIAGLLTGVNLVIQKLTKQSGATIIEKEGKIIIFHPRELITGIIICNTKLKSLSLLLDKLLDKVEDIYGAVLLNWDGNLKIFAPIENITQEIFSI